MDQELAKQVWDKLERFKTIDDARELYCNILNYEFTDLPLPTQDWTKPAREVTVQARVIAKRRDFYVISCIIQKLTRRNERDVVNELLKRFPDAVFIFTDQPEREWHVISPKYDTESKKFVLRRYAVGASERLRTAAERLSLTYAAEEDSATQLKEKHDAAFDVKAVTKEFFEEYKKIFAILENGFLKQRGDKLTAHGFTQQLLNRFMFLYFIQKKGWLGGRPDFIPRLLDRYKKEGPIGKGVYHEWIKPLFFHAFNKTPIPESCRLPSDIGQIYERMPFLNGGLFSETPLDEIGYEVKDDHIRRLVEGLLERFNFTIREDTPLDVEVAVDPEMLGKVYESLVFEEERGKSGIFFTPRVEVDFMCRQAIVEYLVENVELPCEKIIPFVYETFGGEEEKVELSKDKLKKMREALWRVKVVDPACGSGAFLVGMAHVLLDLHKCIALRLDETEPDYFELKKNIFHNNIYGADIKEWAVRVAELRLWLALIVDADESKLDMHSKPLLPNLTLKLRVGDSLVQEIGKRPLSARGAYRYLPKNVAEDLRKLMEFKHDYFFGKQKSEVLAERIRDFKLRILKKLIKNRLDKISGELNKLKGIQQRLLPEEGVEPDVEKRTNREEIEAEKEELIKTLKALEAGKAGQQFFWEIDFADVFADGGFDIVIGNPPYVRQELIAPANLLPHEITDKVKKAYKEALVRSVYAHWGKKFIKDMGSDFYIYFFYHGLALLKSGGVFCFVTSNSWLDVDFGTKFQQFLLRNIEVKAVYDNLARRTFAESDINTVISILKRPRLREGLASNLVRLIAFKKPFEKAITPKNLLEATGPDGVVIREDFRSYSLSQLKLWSEGIITDGIVYIQETLGESFKGKYQGGKWGAKFLRSPDIYFTLIKKAGSKLIQLERIADLSYGLKTGINEFFFFTPEKAKEFGIERQFLKPIIASTKDMRTYTINEHTSKTLLFTCHKDTQELKGTNALKYIQWGEHQTTQERGGYKRGGILFPNVASVKGRSRWYDVGTRTPGDFVINQFIDKRFFFPTNDAHLLVSNVVFEGTWKKGIDCELQNALLNSTITYSFVEIFGRANLGEGLLTLYGPDISMVPVVYDSNINQKTRDQIVAAFAKIKKREVEVISKEVEKEDRKELDRLVFSLLGLDEQEQREIRDSLLQMVKSRLEKAVSLNKQVSVQGGLV